MLALMVLSLLSLALVQISLRLVADSGFTWAEPVARLMVMWLALLGALAATRQHKHVTIDALPRLLGPRARRVAWVLAQLAGAAAAGVLAWLALDLLAMELDSPSRLPGGIPGWAGMLVLPPGFALMGLRFLLAAFMVPPDARAAAR